MDDDQNVPVALLNADDFTDRPPKREECRRLLEEASESTDRIAAWNRLRERMSKSNPDWYPDMSDQANPWVAKGLVLCLETPEGDWEYVNLQSACLDNADLREAGLRKARLGKASLIRTQLDGANLEEANLDQANLSSAIARSNLQGASFYAANMRGIGLHAALLNNAKLDFAKLEEAYMSDAQLKDARLQHAKLRKADLAGSCLKGADLSFADLSQCMLDHEASLENAKLHETQFESPPGFKWNDMRSWSRLKSRFVTGSCAIDPPENSDPTTLLDGADLRTAIGFIPNGQSANGTLFAARSTDPYSIVRGKYTGPLMLFNLIFLGLFFVPYILRSGGWTVAERVQLPMIESLMHDAPIMDTETKHIVTLVLGFDQGWFWGVISIIFILYNLARGGVTWWMSQVRDAEERSGHLPVIKDYWWCYSLHTFALRYVFWGAMIMFIINLVRWMSETVTVPVIP
jgi:uncharacterized protein YjbI with pentapeptide repeats